MLHRVGHFTAKNVPGGWGISSHDNFENPCPHYSPRLGGWGLQLTAALPSLRGDINIDTTHNGSAKYALFTFCRLTCGIIARSAGLFQNSKKFCACDGKILWEDKPLYVSTRSPPSQL